MLEQSLKSFDYHHQAVSEEKYNEMVADQLEKLQQEKADRARDGAATPPSPAQPTDPVDTRQVRLHDSSKGNLFYILIQQQTCR